MTSVLLRTASSSNKNKSIIQTYEQMCIHNSNIIIISSSNNNKNPHYTTDTCLCNQNVKKCLKLSRRTLLVAFQEAPAVIIAAVLVEEDVEEEIIITIAVTKITKARNNNKT